MGPDWPAWCPSRRCGARLVPVLGTGPAPSGGPPRPRRQGWFPGVKPHAPPSGSSQNVPKEKIPDTESLKDTYERVIKFYDEEIKFQLKNKNILISAHGNSIRALCKYLFKLDNNQISKLEIPTGNPLMIQINDEHQIQNCEYLDKVRAKDLLVF